MLPVTIAAHLSKAQSPPQAGERAEPSQGSRSSSSAGDSVRSTSPHSISEVETSSQIAAYARKISELHRLNDFDPSFEKITKSDDVEKAVIMLKARLQARVDESPDDEELRAQYNRIHIVQSTQATSRLAQRTIVPSDLIVDSHSPIVQMQNGLHVIEHMKHGIVLERNSVRDLHYRLLTRKFDDLITEFTAYRDRYQTEDGHAANRTRNAEKASRKITADLTRRFADLHLGDSTTFTDAFELLDDVHVAGLRHSVPFESHEYTERSKISEALCDHIGALRLAELRNKDLVRDQFGYQNNLGVRASVTKFVDFFAQAKDSIAAFHRYVDDTTFETAQAYRSSLRKLELQYLLSNSSDANLSRPIGTIAFGLALDSKFHRCLVERSAIDTQAARLSQNEFESLLKLIGVSQRSAPTIHSRGKQKARRSPANVSQKKTVVDPEIDHAVDDTQLLARIADKQGHLHPAQRLEGDIANMTREICEKQLTSFARLLGFNVIVRDTAQKRVIAEFDIDTNVAIIEVTLKSRDKYKQIANRALNKDNMNRDGRPVILYAPNYTDVARAEIDALKAMKEAAPVFVTRTEEELCTVLKRLDDNLFARIASQIGFVRRS